jgi:hypothetical protein
MTIIYKIFSLISIMSTLPILAQEVSTIAGSSQGTLDGIGSTAQFNLPFGLTVQRDSLFIADTNNHRIRVVNIKSGTVSTLAGNSEGFNNGVGVSALFDSPAGIAVRGDSLFVADSDNHRIRLVQISNGIVSTLAGDGTPGDVNGTGLTAQFNFPNGVLLSGDSLFVSEV